MSTNKIKVRSRSAPVELSWRELTALIELHGKEVSNYSYPFGTEDAQTEHTNKTIARLVQLNQLRSDMVLETENA